MLFQALSLRAVLTDIFVAAGCSVTEAARIAESLVDANLSGHDSHGVARTQRYVEWLKGGVQYSGQTVEIVTDGGCFLTLDGKYGMGQWIGPQAVNIGIERARHHGVSVVALRHAGHLGRIGEWAEMAACASMISIHFVNVTNSPLVAPFGGVDRRMATNPVCIGVPSGAGSPPVLLDFATSLVAEGKALVALNGGTALPSGSLIGPDGLPNNDPKALYGEVAKGSLPNPMAGPGALRAMGEHKGSGLSVMCELLAGALTGSGTAGPKEQRFCNGMLSIYLAPERVGDRNVEGFYAEVVQYIEWLKSARPAVGTAAVLSPGEPEQCQRTRRLAEGIDIQTDTWESIVTAAGLVGIDRLRLEDISYSNSHPV